jgi:hypothetical protein
MQLVIMPLHLFSYFHFHKNRKLTDLSLCFRSVRFEIVVIIVVVFDLMIQIRSVGQFRFFELFSVLFDSGSGS